MKFEDTLVSEQFIHQAILGARLSYGSGTRSDSFLCLADRYSEARGEYYETELAMGPEDERLVRKLVRAGAGHDKLLRCIPVSVVITGPLMFWSELDTMKVGTVRSSSSLMHRLRRNGKFGVGDFDGIDPLDLERLNTKVRAWVESGEPSNSTSEKWLTWQGSIPRSFLYTSQWVANYSVLRNAYLQRRGHRLYCWAEFLAWAEELPHSWMFIGDTTSVSLQ